MFWFVVAILIAALIVYIAWKLIKTALFVALIAIVLAAGVASLGYHEIHVPKGIINHGQSILATVDHAASTAINRVHHRLETKHHTQ